MSSEIFSAGQASVLDEFWPADAKWFIVGGPAYGNEAQTVAARHPGIKCFGVEPNPEFVKRQLAQDFPGPVANFALWYKDNEILDFSIPRDGSPLSASVCRPSPSPDGNETPKLIYPVITRTLDTLSDKYGPFEDAVLWLDIEYAEIEALRGAFRLLSGGKIKLVNLETFVHTSFPVVTKLLADYGFKFVKRWNEGVDYVHHAIDAIYVLDR